MDSESGQKKDTVSENTTADPVLIMKEPLPIEQVQLGFPVYSVDYSADDSTLFVAGGGGPAKTGVRNAIIAFKHLKKTGMVRKLSELSCGQEAPMCMAIHPTKPEYCAFGVNDRCWVVERDEANHLNLAKSVRSDYATFDSYQKVVRFSGDGHEMLTAGNEDKVRIWDFPWLNPTSEFSLPVDATTSAKERKIEDADYDKTGQYLAVVTAAAIHVRSRTEGTFISVLAPQNGYVFRCARFLKAAKAKNGLLATIENSKSGRDRPLLTLWKTASWTRSTSVKLVTRLRVTTLAVSENGEMVAFGAADGTVGVYDSRLYLLYFMRELHKFIVTSVSVSDRGRHRLLITGSGDGTVRILRIRDSRPWTWSTLITILLFLVLLAYLSFFSSGLLGSEEL